MTTNFPINVIINPIPAERGARRVDGALARTEARANRLRNALRGALAGFSAIIAVRQIGQLADTFNRLENRLRTVTDGQAELGRVTNELFEIANRTRASFEATVEIYARTALSAERLGKSQQDLLTFTERVNKAVAISGASAREARAGLIQLSQGIASNTLRGDELRSVLEQLPVVAQVISRSLGVTRGELRELAAEGKLSADVVLGAFEQFGDELDQRFGEIVPTLGQSFEILRNNLIRFIGQQDRAIGASRGLSQALLFVGENLDTVARFAIAAGVALSTSFAGKGVVAAIRGLRALRVALLTNPITLLPALLAIATGALVAFGDQLDAGTEGFANIQDVAIESLKAIGEFVVETAELFAGLIDTELLNRAFGDIELSAAGLLRFFARIVDNIGAVFNGTILGIRSAWLALPNILSEPARDAVNEVIDILEGFVVTFVAGINTIFDSARSTGRAITGFFSAQARGFKALLSGEFTDAAGFFASANKILERNVKDIGNTFEENRVTADQVIDIPRLEETAETAGLSVGEAFGKGFDEGLAASGDGAQRLAENILAGSDERAAARRIAEENRRRQEENVDLTRRGANTTPDPQEKERLQTLKEFNTALSNETRILQERIALGPQAAAILEAELALRKKGVELTDQERTALEGRIRNLESLRAQAEVLEDIRGPQESFAQRQMALNELLRKGAINGDEFAAAMRGLKLELLENDKTINGGLNRGFEKAKERLEDLASVAENVVTGAFQGLEDVFVQFLTTGKADFKGFVDSILADLARLLARQALLQLVKSLSPGGQFGGVGDFIGKIAQFQDGGVINRTTEPSIVGERGPELFQPERRGRVLTAEQTSAALAGAAQTQAPTVVQAPAPEVNVNVVNQLSGEDIARAVEGNPAFTRSVINVIAANPRAVQRSF